MSIKPNLGKAARFLYVVIGACVIAMPWVFTQFRDYSVLAIIVGLVVMMEGFAGF
jgi:hypothetical protein